MGTDHKSKSEKRMRETMKRQQKRKKKSSHVKAAIDRSKKGKQPKFHKD